MDQGLLDRILRSPKLPTLPAIAIRILDLTQDVNVSIQELASTIQNDQAISAKVLRTVNSSFYGLRRPCTTISQALVMLGLSTVKTLALSFSLVSTLRKSGDDQFDHVGYWKRGLYSASSARLIAKEARLPNMDEAFLGALLQDIGVMAMYQALGGQYMAILKATPDHRMLAKQEMTELEMQHADVGAMLAQRWKLPAELIIPIKFHEQPTAAPEEHGDVVRAVGLGNIACDVVLAKNPGPALRRFHACGARWFKFSASQCDDMLKQAAIAAKEMSSLFTLNIGEAVSTEAILERAEQQLVTLSEQVEQGHAEEAPFNRLVSDSHQFDPLTGALTRRALVTQAMELMEQAPAQGGSIAVAAIEVDGFAALQARLEQEDADALLVETASVLEQHLAPMEAQIARWDRGVFVVMMPGDEPTAHSAMERVRKTLERQAPSWFSQPGSSMPTWSAGVVAMEVETAEGTQQGMNLVGAALRALESARRCGGSQTQVEPQRIAA